MRATITVLAVVAAVLSLSALASAAASKGTYSYRATLTAGQEVPKPTGVKRTAGGTFSATAKDTAGGASLRWTLTFRNLTGKAVAAHIHMGAKGQAGNVLVALCAAPAKPCKTGMTGRATVSKDVADALERGAAYVNVHTAKNGGGEIRGQIRLVGHT
ncbi:MAG: CHRD domain-containing protein [Pseudomonadota bacterium]